MTPNVPIDVINKFPQLDAMLIELLQSLTPQEWQKQTVAKLWTVKDVAAHLLDGNIRILSMMRDRHTFESPAINSYESLVQYLNTLNADWVKAMKRVSPQMLIFLHQTTGPLYSAYYSSLDPWGKSLFSVDWAGENESKNWMHIAREYTEKFLHQQQIRDATNKPGLMIREFFYPFIDVFMMALPHTYKNFEAENGTTIKVTITSDIGGSWLLTRIDNSWNLSKSTTEEITSEISIPPNIAWKLFSKSIRPEQVRDSIIITGNEKLGGVALTMVSVMA